jgi:hypothetical protein
MNRFLAIISSVVLLSLSACPTNSLPRANLNQAANPGGIPEDLVLRTYEVPNNGAERMRSVLKDLFWFGSDGKDSNKYVGRADVAPDGRLVVLAPENVHEGVKALVSATSNVAPKAPESVLLSYWIVTGAPGKHDGVQPELAEVSLALAEIEKHDGPMNFELTERIQVTSLSGERGKMDGRDTRVQQFGTLFDGHFTGDIRLERFGQSVDTRVRMKNDQLLVLGSSGLPTKNPGDAPRNVYFLVRATSDSKSP